MHLADPRGYLGFLYMNPRLPALRGQLFRRSFQHAFALGRLQDVVTEAPTDDGLIFLEPAMRLRDVAFEIGFGQMPLVAAFINIVYLGITPERFEAICTPVMTTPAGDIADTVASSLRRAVLDWLQSQLESEHYVRQASALHHFCKQRGLSGPDEIDDETIFSFWESHCDVAKVDGFRKFRNAAHKMLVYRRSWMDKRIERNILAAASLDHTSSGQGGDSLDPERSLLEPLASAEWTSPLTILASPPCEEAAWITQVDRALLAHLIADPKLVDGREVEAKEATSLFGNEPPSETFFRTVLRFTFFGALQGAMIKGSKTGPYADFAEVATLYRRIEANIRRTITHAARLLTEHGHPTGHRAVIHLFPEIRSRLQAWIGRKGPAALPRLSEMTEIILEDGDSIARKLRQSSVNRVGLRPEDIRGEDDREAFSTGADAMLAAHTYLERYLAWLEQQNLERCFNEDMALFLPQLQRLYGGGAVSRARSKSAGT